MVKYFMILALFSIKYSYKRIDFLIKDDFSNNTIHMQNCQGFISDRTIIWKHVTIWKKQSEYTHRNYLIVRNILAILILKDKFHVKFGGKIHRLHILWIWLYHYIDSMIQLWPKLHMAWELIKHELNNTNVVSSSI